MPDTEAKVVAALDRALRDLSTHKVGSDEYKKTLDHVKELHKMRESDRSRTVKPETWVMAGTNLLGILMVLRHEQLNVITTKAFSFIPKPKL